MLIVRNSVRLSALVAALALAGCGSGSGTGGGDCDPDNSRKGCVAIWNFRSTTETFSNVSIAPRHPSSQGGIEPGRSGVLVSNTSVGATNTFQGTIGGQNVSVTCTVTTTGWSEGNPRVIIQQEAFGALVNCGPDW